MRVFTGAVAVPFITALILATAGCGSAVLPAGSAVPGAAPTVVPTSTPAGMAVSIPGTAPGSSSQSTATPTRFPGIWDITSWRQYRAAQTAVEQGDEPWLLDAGSVVRAWAASRWQTPPTVRQITDDSYQVTEPGTGVVDTISGTCPDSGSDAPIWVITAIVPS